MGIGSNVGRRSAVDVVVVVVVVVELKMRVLMAVGRCRRN